MTFYFHLTEKMVGDIKSGKLSFSGFSVRNNGRNYQIEIECEEVESRDKKSKENQWGDKDKSQKEENAKSNINTNIESEKLTDILERYGCAWQENN